MPIFEYKAVDNEGSQKRGTVESDNIKNARLKLKRQGLLVSSIEERASRLNNSTTKSSFSSGIFSRVSSADISFLARQLASLVKANIPLVDSLKAIVEQTEKMKLKVILDDVKRQVNEGSSLGKALSSHSNVFDNVFINMVEAGESSGSLGTVLLRLADLKEGQTRLKRKVVGGMAYPIILMFVGLALVVGIFTFVIPKLVQVFESLNREMPVSTQILIKMSEFLVGQWPVILAGVGFIFFIFNRHIATSRGRKRWDRFKLTAPVFGPILRLVAMTRFSNALGTLLGSGVPILTSMNIAKNLVGNVIIEEAISIAKENVKEGQSIAEPLRKSGEFPPMLIHMISIGEKTGELSDMLKNVSETYEEQVNGKIEVLTTLLEPIMIMFMAGFVIFIAFTVFVPLMEVMEIQ